MVAHGSPASSCRGCRRRRISSAVTTCNANSPARRWACANSRPPTDATLAARLAETPDPPLLLTHDEALALCESISARTGVSVTLPTADELESTARGTDGRRFPWGNGVEKVDGRVRSPHGIERFSTPMAQWTESRDANQVPLVLGGPHSPHC